LFKPRENIERLFFSETMVPLKANLAEMFLGQKNIPVKPIAPNA
jgi:hypothetical protein